MEIELVEGGRGGGESRILLLMQTNFSVSTINTVILESFNFMVNGRALGGCVDVACGFGVCVVDA